MKTVKSALLGAKELIDTNNDVLLLQLEAIIKEHRAIIITRLVAEIPTYMDYKFGVKPSKETELKIKERLMSLKRSGVGLSHYDTVVKQLMNRSLVHLTNEPFYDEIGAQLQDFAKSKELKFS